MRKAATAQGRLGRRVLVCDDERHIVRLIQVNLERQGYEVTCAFDGRQALEKLGQGTFEIAILDLMMPHVDGYEVLSWIRTHKETQAMWVAMMIAKSQDRETWEQLPYQADIYVVKPFDPTDLFGPRS